MPKSKVRKNHKQRSIKRRNRKQNERAAFMNVQKKRQEAIMKYLQEQMEKNKQNLTNSDEEE